VEAGGTRRELVLRSDPEGERDPAAREREFTLLRAAHAAGVPVPEPLWLRDDGSGIVMERVEGEAIARRLLRDERYTRARERLVGQVAAAAAAIHDVDLAGLDLEVGDGPPAEAAIAALEAQLDALGEPHPALELGLRWLRRNLPDPVAPTLVHGDFRLGNWLVDEEGLAAVLDWELCHAGDAAEDLAWLCIRSWRFGSDELAAAGLGSRDDLLAAYARAGGRAVTRDELRFWEVMGNVRWGVICVMQADRHLSGSRRSLEHAAIGRRTCEPEWDLLAMVGE
jgi:aminoglycoside phosphotransferase (APT) family kinase protein